MERQLPILTDLVKDAPIAPRLGKVLNYEKTDVDSLIEKIPEIQQALKDYGVIVLKNIHFTSAEQVKFGKAFGGDDSELVKLPSLLSWGNQDPEFKEISRVGNVMPDGTLKGPDAVLAATRWHQDGAMFEDYNGRLIAFLQTKEIPEIGGGTWWIDTQEAWKYYQETYPEKAEQFKKATVRLCTDHIPKFAEMRKNGLLQLPDTLHPLVSIHPWNGKEVMFLGNGHDGAAKIEGTDSPFLVTDIIQEIIKKIGVYKHTWEDGDMVGWDNKTTLHRAAGDWQGRRLLCRVQVRLHLDDYKEAMKNQVATEEGDVRKKLEDFILHFE